ncbi:transmembrane protein 6/97 [Geopyxis carbonaria]|nr:transmembrane protein 6/97 [Geopyxis carbonaria]
MTLSRPRDTLITLFILSFIPTILFFDILHLYPAHLVPAVLLDTQEWYKTFFNDVLTIHHPAYFAFFKYVEAFYELPVALYAAWALARGGGSGGVYAHLLVWAVVCALTTATCVWEYVVSEVMSEQERMVLVGMYGGYGLIFAAIAGDMFCRIQGAVKGASQAQIGKKRA